MNYSKLIQSEFEKKNINLNIDEAPLSIFFKTGDVLDLCFIERETIDALLVYETISKFENDEILLSDELRIVPKDNIDYISLVYDLELLDVDINVKDKMFL